jgi:histidinol-phosphate phosphatase family protein
MTQAVILAGGKGTRLSARLGGLPKPLVDVAGIPLLGRQIDYLGRFGIDDVLLLVNHRADEIARYIAERPSARVKVRLVDDGEPCGTSGAVLAAFEQLAERFFVVYGDTLVNVDLAAMQAAHVARDADATLLLHPNNHPEDSDIVEMDDEGWVRHFHPYPHPKTRYLPNLVNAALYVVEKRTLLPYRKFPAPSDFGKNLFPAMVADGAKLFGYTSYEYIRDLGTPKRLDEVVHDLETGRVARGNLKVPQKAVFVDRDGTLNVSRGFIADPAALELLPGVAAAVRRLNQLEYRVIVATNQPVVARGEASFEQLKEIHNKLETLLGREGAFVDAIYVCPHHPDKGFAGEVAALKIDCDCRKPKIGLVERATNTMNVDLSASWMIGDTTRDILTAQRAGLRSILVQTGEAGRDGLFDARPDHTASDFAGAVEHIVGQDART